MPVCQIVQVKSQIGIISARLQLRGQSQEGLQYAAYYNMKIFILSLKNDKNTY